MRRILSGALIALSIMGFGLVSSVNTPAAASPVGPMCWAGSCPDMSKVHAVTHPGPYACGIASPAYTFYYNANALHCRSNGNLAITPNPKGSN